MAAALPAIEEVPSGEVDDAKNPQKHGWVVKNAYDYDTYNKTTKELHEADHSMGVETGGWASNAVVYEWNEEYGDVGPEFPLLEQQLFGGEFRMTQGINFAK